MTSVDMKNKFLLVITFSSFPLDDQTRKKKRSADGFAGGKAYFK